MNKLLELIRNFGRGNTYVYDHYNMRKETTMQKIQYSQKKCKILLNLNGQVKVLNLIVLLVNHVKAEPLNIFNCTEYNNTFL